MQIKNNKMDKIPSDTYITLISLGIGIPTVVHGYYRGRPKHISEKERQFYAQCRTVFGKKYLSKNPIKLKLRAIARKFWDIFLA